MVYARRARRRGDRVVGMVSLETIGYYSDRPGSQRYPPFLRLFYPGRGNFLGFVANLRSRPLLHRVVAAFRASSDWPVQSAGYCQVSVVEARGGAVEDGWLQDSAGARLLAPRAEGAISAHSVVG